jgi:hypothetical protein
VHELKHDGYRLQIHVRDGRVRLFTMNGNNWTDRYPRIVEEASRTHPHVRKRAERCLGAVFSVLWAVSQFFQQSMSAQHYLPDCGRRDAVFQEQAGLGT